MFYEPKEGRDNFSDLCFPAKMRSGSLKNFSNFDLIQLSKNKNSFLKKKWRKFLGTDGKTSHLSDKKIYLKLTTNLFFPLKYLHIYFFIAKKLSEKTSLDEEGSRVRKGELQMRKKNQTLILIYKNLFCKCFIFC